MMWKDAPMKNAIKPFTRIVYLGETFQNRKYESVFIKIKWHDERLSFTGVVGPTENGDASEYGQISKPVIVEFASNITELYVDGIFREWERWHLNDLRAGTPAQEQYIRENKLNGDYEKVLQELTDAGLNPDPETGYNYGSAWLHEEVPDYVLCYLQNLPLPEKQPAWI